MPCSVLLINIFLLQGIESVQIGKAAEDLMKDLDLVQHSNTLAANLTGSEKRRLCVANALIGKPKLVVLDEPAAGIDPLTRRYIWKGGVICCVDI